MTVAAAEAADETGVTAAVLTAPALEILPREPVADAAPDTRQVIPLPPLRGSIAYALRYLVLGTVIPMSLFYGLFTYAGLDVALLGVLAWSSGLIAHRVRGARRVEATLVLSTVLMLVRVGVTWTTGSAFVYLLQPVVSTFVTAAALLGSVAIRRPFVERVIRDFVPLPADLCGDASVLRCFCRISLVWGVGYLLSGSASLWLLTHLSMGSFMVFSKTAGLTVSAVALLVSLALVVTTLRRHHIAVRFGAADARV